MKYVYLPIYHDPATGYYEPGKTEDGSVVSASGDLVGGIHTLKLDNPTRYVFHVPEDMGLLNGWEVKTTSEINQDYPGLIQL